jgi:hypothetical protein
MGMTSPATDALKGDESKATAVGTPPDVNSRDFTDA